MNKVLCVLFGYFIRTINPAYLLGKRKGIDIRTQGSGKELHLSYLWNKDKELERLRQNMH